MGTSEFLVTLVKEADWPAYQKAIDERSTAGLCLEEVFKATSKADAHAQARSRFPGYLVDTSSTHCLG